MEYIVGLLAGLLICTIGYAARLDRDAAFYPTVLGAIATYYVLFAAMTAHDALVPEAIVATIFLAAAIAGHLVNLWIVVAGLVLHGLFDFVHHLLIDNPGVPKWWPGFCLAIDVTLGLGLAVLLVARHSRNEGSGR